MKESSDSSLPQGWQETFDPELHRAIEFANQSVDPEIVDYSKIKMGKTTLKLSGDGVFYTLQGEGPTLGLPCVFVRLHVCNLKCSWCDAWYTWNPNTPEYWTEGFNVDFYNAAKLIQTGWHGPQDIEKRVIWTGGEPLIQRNQIEEVCKILDDWWEYDVQYEIETNGTLMPTEYMLNCFQFNCSPKLANSDNRKESRIKPKILKELNSASTSFKFVVTALEDLDEIEQDFLPWIDQDRVIIMPQGITEEEVSANAKILVDECLARGLRLMPRFQNICWDGARRGV